MWQERINNFLVRFFILLFNMIKKINNITLTNYIFRKLIKYLNSLNCFFCFTRRRKSLGKLYPQFSRLANVGMASRYGNSDNYVAEVDAVTLDSIVGWDVDLIKIDVEGSEVSVLRGAERTSEATHPFLVVEAREENQKMAGGSLEELSNSLKRLGYIHRWQWGGDACLQHPLRKPLWTHYS